MNIFIHVSHFPSITLLVFGLFFYHNCIFLFFLSPSLPLSFTFYKLFPPSYYFFSFLIHPCWTCVITPVGSIRGRGLCDQGNDNWIDPSSNSHFSRLVSLLSLKSGADTDRLSLIQTQKRPKRGGLALQPVSPDFTHKSVKEVSPLMHPLLGLFKPQLCCFQTGLIECRVILDFVDDVKDLEVDIYSKLDKWAQKISVFILIMMEELLFFVL